MSYRQDASSSAWECLVLRLWRAGHGTPYGMPLARTREYVSIIRRIVARDEPLEHSGEHYQIPATGHGHDRAR